MSAHTGASEIAREYRRKYGMDMPTLKLARIMYNENKLFFKDVDHARQRLRYIEGKLGASQIKKLANKEFVTEKERPKNPYTIPKSDEEEYKPYYIKGHKRGLIICDLHIPYHSVSAIKAMMDFGLKYKPDFIFCNGDILDCHQLSYFQKDPKKKRFSEELEMACDFLKELKRVFKCKIYLKFANHEERYDNFIFQKAHELKGVDEFELETLFKNRVPDLEVIKDKRIVVIGGLPFIHGHEYGRGIFSPVNAARGLALQAKHNAVKGDCHQTSEHNTKNIFGKMMSTFSVGCLCGLTPKWLPLNQWNHGVATIDIEGASKFKFKNYRIQDGEIY